MTDVTPDQFLPNTLNGSQIVVIDAALVTSGVRVVNANPGQMVIRLTNTAAGALNFTVGAGDRPPALGAGAQVYSMPGAGAVRYITPLDSGQHMTSDGSIDLTFETGFVGELEIYEIARNA